MTRMQTSAQLRRLGHLSKIQCMNAKLRSMNPAQVGLMDIADALRMHVSVTAMRDCHAARDALLSIACEWDLQRDRLDEQSDACLAEIVSFLRSP